MDVKLYNQARPIKHHAARTLTPELKSHIFRRTTLLLLISLATLLVACTPSHPQSTFDTLGPVARSQVNLFWVIFWAGLVVSVAVMAVLIYIMVRYRARPGDGDH